MLTIKVSGKQGEGKTKLIDNMTTALAGLGYVVISEDSVAGGEVTRGGPINGVLNGIVRVVEVQPVTRKPKEG